MTINNSSNNLFEQYLNQSSYVELNDAFHSDGHLDGDVAGRHTDEHADKA